LMRGYVMVGEFTDSNVARTRVRWGDCNGAASLPPAGTTTEIVANNLVFILWPAKSAIAFLPTRCCRPATGGPLLGMTHDQVQQAVGPGVDGKVDDSKAVPR
jgi:hypothetical protein